MYHAHFGLERGLFGEGIAAEANVFRSGKHDRLIAHFKLALASPSSAIVLHGAAGVGKTTLTATALRASSTRLALAWINAMPTNAAELLELILAELGVDALRATRIERVQLWRQFQAEMRATDSRLFIVAERAEDLSPGVLHALDQLTAPDAVGHPGANLVLLGHAGIGEHLADPLLDSLRQRVRLRAEIEPFTEAELQDYMRHQVASAGGHFDRIFAPGTVAALFRYSKGVARLANTLCESALDIAAVQRHKQLTPELVAKTAVSLLGLAEPVAAARPAVTAPRVEPASVVTAPRVEPAPSATTPRVEPAPPVATPRVEPTSSVETRPAPRPMPQFTSPAAVPSAAAALPTTPAAVPPRRLLEPPAATAPAASIPIPTMAPPPPAPTIAAPAPSKPVEIEFDGSSTDVADVALADFPVLTDAVDLPEPAAAAKLPAQATAKATAAAPAAPAAHVATPTAPTPVPAARVAAAKPAASSPPAPAMPQDSEDDDGLRQTQTMRAIAAAKSLDDISDADAETLFGDAELDLVSAALASAAEWPDDDDLTPTPAPTPEVTKAAKPQAPKAPAADDPFDLFGLGDDAPLELMDDSTLPPASPARRTAIR